MRTWIEHRDATLALVAPLPVVEVGLADALGAVLAQDVVTDTPMPRWDNSAMDGYAVRHADIASATAATPVVLPVVADLPAGTAERPFLAPGNAARIMTGAPVPDGADTIVPVELTDAGTVRVRIDDAPPAGRHVRHAGGDAAAGDLVVAAGTLLGPAQVAAVASVGRSRVPVHRRPRVAVVSTGDELVAPGEPVRYGTLPDSNSWLLAAAVQEAGGEALRLGPTSDDPQALLALLHGLDDGALHGPVDLVVTSGGVSVGAFDVVKAALRDEPDVEFVPVAVQPGKPQGLGRLRGGTPLCALPGNPVSSFVSFELFVRPAVLRLRGLADVHRPTVTAVVEDGWRTPPGRAQVMPVRFGTGEQPRVRRATPGGSGSHLVARLALADGLALVPAEVDEVEPGDRLTVMRLRA
ncbi:molybdopterin molybdotransferase MoeA [Cellulomonas soli]|uniref:molybdopterin molybdotransferase MoeA n=1 Tax=Cellulomonas soli TaxID=931535 RepID=UPI003F85399B